ncbi:tyrosine-type recombinase/integrase [Eubacterium ventriosum]
MKNELIDSIVTHMSARYGLEAEQLKTLLIIELKDYDVVKKETAISVRSEDVNEEIFKKFLISKHIKGCSERTIHFYGKTLKYVFERIKKPYNEVETDDIRLYIAYRDMRDGVSKTTQGNEIRILRSFYSFCMTEEYISRDPMRKVETIKKQKTKKKAFTEIEIEKMRSQCRNNREKAIVEILLSTGCRVTELVNIKLADIQNDSILITGKGNKQRYVYLNAKAVFAMEQYMAERKDKNEYLFPGGFFGNTDGKNNRDWYKNPKLVNVTHADKGTIESLIRKIGCKCDVKAYPHKFRRTCATMALRRGMPIEQVSRMLGHEELTTTQIYLDIDEKDMENAHRKYVV